VLNSYASTQLSNSRIMYKGGIFPGSICVRVKPEISKPSTNALSREIASAPHKEEFLSK
jgi:hypothetical protein